MDQRCAAVETEQLRILPPLKAFFEPLKASERSPTFQEAVQDVLAAYRTGTLTNADDMNWDEFDAVCSTCVDTGADRKGFGDPTPLSQDHISVLALYTAEFAGKSFYQVMNYELVHRRKLTSFLKIVWLLMEALGKCQPCESRMVYRGVKKTLTGYSKGRKISWYQFSSCTPDIEVQREFLGEVGPRTLFHVELTSDRARSISEYSFHPDENEVLIPMNTPFEVLGVLNAGNGLTIINLKELPVTDPVFEFAAGSAASTTTAPPSAESLPIPPSHAVIEFLRDPRTTGATRQQAEQFIEIFGGDVRAAVQAYFESPGLNYTTPQPSPPPFGSVGGAGADKGEGKGAVPYPAIFPSFLIGSFAGSLSAGAGISMPLPSLNAAETKLLLIAVGFADLATQFYENDLDGDTLMDMEALSELEGRGICGLSSLDFKKLVRLCAPYKTAGVPKDLIERTRREEEERERQMRERLYHPGFYVVSALARLGWCNCGCSCRDASIHLPGLPDIIIVELHSLRKISGIAGIAATKIGHHLAVRKALQDTMYVLYVHTMLPRV